MEQSVDLLVNGCSSHISKVRWLSTITHNSIVDSHTQTGTVTDHTYVAWKVCVLDVHIPGHSLIFCHLAQINGGAHLLLTVERVRIKPDKSIGRDKLSFGCDN